mmetsp:Transcript_12338/g.26586  ORF Transcript_12338/g.26586 Transcript_12338/m.26586 type:complete len:244 (+) Transcript_12338:993-1724(+)
MRRRSFVRSRYVSADDSVRFFLAAAASASLAAFLARFSLCNADSFSCCRSFSRVGNLRRQRTQMGWPEAVVLIFLDDGGGTTSHFASVSSRISLTRSDHLSMSLACFLRGWWMPAALVSPAERVDSFLWTTFFWSFVFSMAATSFSDLTVVLESLGGIVVLRLMAIFGLSSTFSGLLSTADPGVGVAFFVDSPPPSAAVATPDTASPPPPSPPFPSSPPIGRNLPFPPSASPSYRKYFFFALP